MKRSSHRRSTIFPFHPKPNTFLAVSVGVFTFLCGVFFPTVCLAQTASNTIAAKTGSGKALFLFEYGYVNWKSGYKGIVVDEKGNLFSYDRSGEQWKPASYTAPTLVELEEKFTPNRTLLRTLSAEELAAKVKLIPAAAAGKQSERRSEGMDMGSHSSSLYQFDAVSGTYREIELRVRGDWSYENLAPEAKELADWLESLK